MNTWFTSVLADTQAFVYAPMVQAFLAPCLAFFIGGLVGLVLFINDFTDKPMVVLRSWPCHMYAVYNGTLAVIAFKVLETFEIHILSLSISDHPYLLAVLIGGVGFALITSYRPDQSEADKKVSIVLQILFQKIHAVLYHQYGIIRNTKLRPLVSEIMNNVDDSNVWEFARKCVLQAIDVNGEKGNALGESYKRYKESSLQPGAHKVEIGMDLAKVIGVQLLSQIAEEMKDAPSLKDDIQSLEEIIAKMQAKRPQEDKDGTT